MSNPFAQMDPSLKTETAKSSFTSITWNGSPNKPDRLGYWTMPTNSLNGIPQGWEETVLEFFDNGKTVQEPSVRSHVLRCTPIGHRKCAMIEVDRGLKKLVDFYAKQSERPAGKRHPLVQVMVRIEGLPDPVVISLGKFSRATMWLNDPADKLYIDRFPDGAFVRLQRYAREMEKQYGLAPNSLDPFMYWTVDLRGAVKGGQWYFVEAGQNQQMVPFVLDMKVDDDPSTGYPSARYVGHERFEENQEWRRKYAIPWEEEWAKLRSEPVDAETFGSDDYTDAEEPAFAKPNGSAPKPQAQPVQDDFPF